MALTPGRRRMKPGNAVGKCGPGSGGNQDLHTPFARRPGGAAQQNPKLVEQEFYGMMPSHRAVRTLMNEAAQHQHVDPDRLSFTHSLRVIRRKPAVMPALSP